MGACVAVPARWEIESKIHSQEKQRDLTSESFLAQGDNRGSACSIMIIYSSKITHYHHTTTATPIHSLHITPTPTVHITNIPTPTYTSPTSLPQLTRHHHPYPTLHLTTPLTPTLTLPTSRRPLCLGGGGSGWGCGRRCGGGGGVLHGQHQRGQQVGVRRVDEAAGVTGRQVALPHDDVHLAGRDAWLAGHEARQH